MRKIEFDSNKYTDIDFLISDSLRVGASHAGTRVSLLFHAVGRSKNLLGDNVVVMYFKICNNSESNIYAYINNLHNRCQSTKYGVVKIYNNDAGSKDIPKGSFFVVKYTIDMPEVSEGDFFHFYIDSISVNIGYKNSSFYLLDDGETIENIPVEVVSKTDLSQALEKDIEMLNKLIGLNEVKKNVITMTNYIRIRQLRQVQGLKTSTISYHSVFTGNPGTGKTTVARIVGRIYHDLGILEKGHVIETDRSGLVAEYVGHTAIKTNNLIDRALDGVLFIDEAYTLANGDNQDFGHEAIATLLKRMEDDRDRLVVILAGYSKEMDRFIQSNPGLQSRFSRKIEFVDYTDKELLQIFSLLVEENEYTITRNAYDTVQKLISNQLRKTDRNFGNGRYVRNLFEKIIENQANRLAQQGFLSAKQLTQITEDDVRDDSILS